MKSEQQKIKTPSLPDWILRRVLSLDDYMEFQENLEEIYNQMILDSGQACASRWYWMRFLESLPSIIWEGFLWRIQMIKNNLKLAIRSFKKDKFHSLINVIGLSIGITFSIIILLLVQNDLSTDMHHQKVNRIYRYGINMTIGGRNSTQAGCNPGVGPVLTREFPGIESFTRFFNCGDISIKKGENAFLEKNFLVTDNNVFQIFSHDFIYGIPENALREPNTMVLSKKISNKIFGNKNPVGETVEVEGMGLLTITAVIENLPDNSHQKFDGLISYPSIANQFDPAKIENPKYFSGNMGNITYFLFREGYTEAQFNRDFERFYKEKMAATDRIQYRSVVEPFADIYLNSKIWPQYSQRNRAFLLAFVAIGFFILTLACINYINLATSRFSGRAKEIGLKKVVGAERKQLIGQFITESLILSFISMLLAFLLVKGILTFTPFNNLIQKSLSLNLFGNPLLIFGSLMIMFLTGLISGIYPSFYLSRVSPAKIFKNDKVPSAGKFFLRNSLVVFQFTISIGIIIMTFLMNNQMRFVQNFNPGFQKENLMLIQVNNKDLLNQMGAFKEELSNYHGIAGAAFSNAYTGYNIYGMAFKWETEEGDMKGHAFNLMQVDPDYFKTMGIRILKGRNFDHTRMGTESKGNMDLIVNEALVKHLGWTDPMGKRTDWGTVIGVVNDFNYSSLHTAIRPMFLILPRQNPSIINVRINPNYFSDAVKFVKQTWRKFFPSNPIHTMFLDREIEQLYQNDLRQMGLTRLFSLVCILICCLGLLGLTSYSTEKRTKEIAVRKVLGASVSQIVRNLFKPILAIVFWALVIASPIAYYLGHWWLKNFVYKSSISPAIFVISGLVAIIIAFLTASYHSIRVATKKPVNTLKYE